MPVQSGTRMPAILNLVTRAVSGPLDIHGDHSDLYYALNTGWVILLARDPQAVYDMNIVATRLSEHPDVRLPVIVAYDGFFTSHQKRPVHHFENSRTVRDFVGPQPAGFPPALDPRNPVTFGPYMNEPDMINNKYQLHLAMDAVRRVLPELLGRYATLSDRFYPPVETYHMEDAEVALLLLNSAAETAKDACDRLRAQGIRAGVISPNVLRPFPASLIREACAGLKVLLVGERADSYGAAGGNITHEVKSALKDDPHNHTVVLSRVFGLGGKDFCEADAAALYSVALQVARQGASPGVPVFDYYGMTAVTENIARQVLPPFTKAALSTGLTRCEVQENGLLKAVISPPRKMLERPKRIAPGHGACPGCGIFPAINQFLQAIEGDVVVLYQTGCAMVTTTGYPHSSHRVTYVHNLFQNGAATLSGIVEAFHEKRRRGEIAVNDDFTFIMISGDGGMDIGMGSAIGAAIRNHNMIILEYDNEGYMNTGSQLSYSTPLGHKTATSNVGPMAQGKMFHHKDTAEIFAATHIPYVFTATSGNPQDTWQKATKAQHYARHQGLVYGKMLSACPLNWQSDESRGEEIVQAAVDSCFFPLYEVELGRTRLTYDPEAKGKKIPVDGWLGSMGKSRHMLTPGNAELLAAFQAEVDRRWRRLKAMDADPNL